MHELGTKAARDELAIEQDRHHHRLFLHGADASADLDAQAGLELVRALGHLVVLAAETGNLAVGLVERARVLRDLVLQHLQLAGALCLCGPRSLCELHESTSRVDQRRDVARLHRVQV